MQFEADAYNTSRLLTTLEKNKRGLNGISPQTEIH